MKITKTECPFCGEEINSIETECPYCGENLPEPENEPGREEPADHQTYEAGPTWISRLFRSACCALGSYLLFHFGSWSIAWNKHVSALEQLLMKYRNGQHFSDSRVIHDLLTDEKSNLILNHEGVLVRVNDSYYGFVNDFQFFDSPVIQWAMLGGAVVLLYYAVIILFGFED